MYACNGILFDNESPRRGRTSVPRKISRTAARADIHLDKQKALYLPGQLESLSLVGRSADLSQASSSQLLLWRDYDVHGVIPRSSNPLHRSAQMYAFRCALPLQANLTFLPLQVTTRSSSCTTMAP